MKKLVFFIAAVFAATLSLSAQTSAEIVSKIEKANHPAIESPLAEKRTSKALGEKDYTAKLIYRGPSYLKLEYDDPSEGFLIDGTKVSITHAGKTAVFDASKNLMMKSMSHALLYAFQGKITELVAEQNASLDATKEGDMYCIVIKALKKSVRGYSTMVINYSVKDCGIRSMRLDEFIGLSTFYELK